MGFLHKGESLRGLGEGCKHVCCQRTVGTLAKPPSQPHRLPAQHDPAAGLASVLAGPCRWIWSLRGAVRAAGHLRKGSPAWWEGQ